MTTTRAGFVLRTRALLALSFIGITLALAAAIFLTAPTRVDAQSVASVDGDFAEWWGSGANCENDRQGWKDGKAIPDAHGSQVQSIAPRLASEVGAGTHVVRAIASFSGNVHRHCATADNANLYISHAISQSVNPSIYGDLQFFSKTCSMIDTTGSGSPEYAACASRQRQACNFSGIGGGSLRSQPCFNGSYSTCQTPGCVGTIGAAREVTELQLLKCLNAACTSRQLVKTYADSAVAYGFKYRQKTFTPDPAEFKMSNGTWDPALLYYYPADDLQAEFKIPLSDLGASRTRVCVKTSASLWNTAYSGIFSPLPAPTNAFADTVNESNALCAVGSAGTSPAPTATPRPTPRPTAVPTPRPTAVPTPRPTAVPTARPTVAPTSTPRPTATTRPAPTATARPAPTATARPQPTPAPAPSTRLIYRQTFTYNARWTTDPLGTDSATTGAWGQGDPEMTTNRGVILQPGNAAAGQGALVTDVRAGLRVGSYDIDRGRSTSDSPRFTLPETGRLELGFEYFFSHLSNSDTNDFFRIQIVDGSRVRTIFAHYGRAVDRDGFWTSKTVDISAYAGKAIQIRIQAGDEGRPSLVEAGIDEITIRQTT